MKLKLPGTILAISSALVSTSAAAIQVSSLFSDHMVLQREQSIPVWGTAEPNENITVQWGETRKSTKSEKDGSWKVEFPPQAAGGPHEISISGSQSKNTVTIRDVMTGDVWIASGQSNMEWPVSRSNDAEKEIASARHPNIRFFVVPKRAAYHPVEHLDSRWQICSPETAGLFSAVGYFFARDLSDELSIPIGIIQSTVGGSPAEAWTPLQALESKFPGLVKRRVEVVTPYLELLKKNQVGGKTPTEANEKTVADKVEADWAAHVATLFATPSKPHDKWFQPTISEDGWSEIQLPGEIEKQLKIDTEGSFWVRKVFELAPEKAGEAGVLHLGPIDDFDETWVNGVKVGSVGRDNPFAWGTQRDYDIPAGVLKAGPNVIIIRVIDQYLNAVFAAHPSKFFLETKSGFRVSLTGPAQARLETSIARKMSLPANDWQFFASTLYDGMIAPLVPYAFRGVIWYQGENNVSRAVQYRTLFPTLIESWRAAWQREFPFYYVQIANCGDPLVQPVESKGAELREAQLQALSVPQTGMAVTTDTGEALDVHPRNKKDVGKRLAALALNREYGKKRVDSGPLLDRVEIAGDQVHLNFKHTGKGLTARPVPPTYSVRSETKETAPLVRNSPESQIEGFSICGEDRQWVWANAKIEGDSVVVSSPKISKPVAVRYAWADNPFANLFNIDGFPASSFRTDDFPEITRNVEVNN